MAESGFRLHVLGVPHTQTHRDFAGCAFTQKVWKFLKMMSGRGHTIFHYGHPRRDWEYPDVEHVTVVTDQDHVQAYGAEYVAGAWRQQGFGSYYAIQDHAHRTFHANTQKEILKRKQPGDLVLHFWGWGTQAVAAALPAMTHIEPGIGSSSAWARWRVYESYAVWNAISGSSAVQTCQQDWYHRVIPNYFDPEDFDYQPRKSDSVLYLGRIGVNKGVNIAIDAAKKAGKQLIIAGQGTLKDMGYTRVPDHVIEHGYATPEQRRRLLSSAQALIIASTYLEPFAGVQVEAWLSGTPVISPDWAAFAELNQHGRTGFRCHRFQDFVEAIQNLDQLDSLTCREHGLEFTLEAIAPRYEQYFQDIRDVLTGAGWYEWRP